MAAPSATKVMSDRTSNARFIAQPPIKRRRSATLPAQFISQLRGGCGKRLAFDATYEANGDGAKRTEYDEEGEKQRVAKAAVPDGDAECQQPAAKHDRQHLWQR